MNTIYENDYLIVKIDKSKSIYYWEWKEKSEELNNETFMMQGTKLLEEFLKSNCTRLISNALNSRFPISPALQEVLAKQLLSVLNGKVDKVAHVLAKELIVGLSTEQTWEENKSTYQDKFFYTLEEALEWIYEN